MKWNSILKLSNILQPEDVLKFRQNCMYVIKNFSKAKVLRTFNYFIYQTLTKHKD